MNCENCYLYSCMRSYEVNPYLSIFTIIIVDVAINPYSIAKHVYKNIARHKCYLNVYLSYLFDSFSEKPLSRTN